MPIPSQAKRLAALGLRFLHFPTRYGGVLVPLLVVTALFIPDPQQHQNQLEKILSRGILRVSTRVGPLIYYKRDDQPEGLDYYLLDELALYLGVRLDIHLSDDLPAVLDQVAEGKADIASANLTVTPDRSARFDFSKPYLEVTSVLIQNRDQPRIHSLNEIKPDATLEVMSGSSHAELLNQLKSQYPQLHWVEEPNILMFELMQRVQNGEIDYAVIDSSIFQLEQPYFPRVEIAAELNDPQPLAWGIKHSGDHSLLDAINGFLQQYRDSGDLDALVRSIYSHTEPFNIAGSMVLRQRIEDRLPKFEPMFREIAGEVGLDWTLLAAVSYQESHWNPRARSPTGVRGLMMLTLPTAHQLGVDNRLDAEQSLRAGARYLKKLHDRVPERIPEPDRTKLALAAYNVGFGHMEDARVLTQRNGDNPDSWDEVKKYLPMLQRRNQYTTVHHGYARGAEAVTYVDNIYHFYNILESHAWLEELEAKRDFFEQPVPEEEIKKPPYNGVLDMPLSPI